MRNALCLAVAAAVALSFACAPQEQEAPAAPPATPEPTPEPLSAAIEVELDASPADVWKVISDFGGIDKWIEVVESVDVEGEGIGAVRTLHLPQGATVLETLRALDEEGMSFSYTIDESPMPVEGYEATMKVSELEGGRAKVEWSSTFRAKGAPDADAEKAISDVYAMGAAGLEKLFPPEAE